MKGGLKRINMGGTKGQKQIRVFIPKECYQELKSKSKEVGMELGHYSGLVLSGYSIKKTQTE